MFKDDRKFIENKYHKTTEAFDPYKRMAYHGYDETINEQFGLKTGTLDGLKTFGQAAKICIGKY